MAGAAGYYLCFVRRSRRGHFPFYVVFLPTAIVFATITVFGASWIVGPDGQVSVIAQATDKAYFWHLDNLKSFVMDFGVGFWIAALGFLLVAVFFVMLRMGRATLPLSLYAGSVAPFAGELEEDEQRRTMRFVWIMISFVPLAIFLFGFLYSIALRFSATDFVKSHLDYLEWAVDAIDTMSIFVLIVVAIGTNVRRVLRRSFHWPPAKYVVISITIPAALAAGWPLANYLYDRVDWAAYAIGIYAAPRLAKYFEFPIWAGLWMLVPALVEEIAWRGFLQPRFIYRYGVTRGIFFVGLVWGAFHFSGDFHIYMTADVVVVTIVHRLCVMVALSYVLAWLTIRSKSVLPAALAHGFYNIFLKLPVHASPWLMPILWAACGWILFRYFPVEPTDEDAATEYGPTLEPVV
ncbi:MAG: CPBP family intramembrane metalloprotease [Acidobacteriia bacterium]|nr:CPBP family intramembrane metalloprotease [Terriglobia bacterium]